MAGLDLRSAGAGARPPACGHAADREGNAPRWLDAPLELRRLAPCRARGFPCGLPGRRRGRCSGFDLGAPRRCARMARLCFRRRAGVGRTPRTSGARPASASIQRRSTAAARASTSSSRTAAARSRSTRSRSSSRPAAGARRLARASVGLLLRANAVERRRRPRVRGRTRRGRSPAEGRVLRPRAAGAARPDPRAGLRRPLAALRALGPRLRRGRAPDHAVERRVAYENDLAQQIGPTSVSTCSTTRASRTRRIASTQHAPPGGTVVDPAELHFDSAGRVARRGARRRMRRRDAHDRWAAALDTSARVDRRRRHAARRHLYAAGVDAGGIATGGYSSGLAQALVLGLAAAEELIS